MMIISSAGYVIRIAKSIWPPARQKFQVCAEAEQLGRRPRGLSHHAMIITSFSSKPATIQLPIMPASQIGVPPNEDCLLPVPEIRFIHKYGRGTRYGPSQSTNMNATTATAATAAAAAEQIEVALQQNRVVTYFDLSAAMLLVYDYFITLPDEIQLIWSSRWGGIQMVFLLNRYAAFWNVGIAIYHQFGSNLSNSTCFGLYTATSWLIACGIGMSEIILIYRTYALWGKRKSVRYALGLLFIAAWIVLVFYLNKVIRSMEFAPVGKILPEYQGCFVTKIDNILYICWSIALAYETILQNYRRTSSPLLYLIFRDSALSYITLLASSVANVLVVRLGPPGYTYLLTGTQHALHVVLSSRIVLNIRRSAVSGAIVASNLVEIELEETQNSVASRSR
ncbi:hypothetical protein EVG20_g3889 [Dentipellis fragilis]|uniref:DUF6533 domain-containing protein n=1 Tax=Dentipellis fragilis TaxID=205917 RepID=A0A4Y9Z0S0_9AGAM|nr:hypothetical protein EVG20_g3889 [Dentipellis fragilis]